MPEPTEPNAEPKGNLPDDVMKTLEEIKAATEKMSQPPPAAPAPSGPSPAEQEREAMKKSLGYTEEQMRAHEASIMRSQAPIIENLGWARLEKKADIETYRKEIEEEMKLYRQENRTPEIMEKVYLMVKGKHADSRPVPSPSSSGRVVDTRVSRGPGYSGGEPGLSSGGTEDRPGEEPLSDVEKMVADKLGVSHKDYASSKKAGRAIRELRVPDARPVASLADVELKRMMGTR